ncbi:hypothetical protein WJU23_13310 [Prosthecobacter sp. SYSU 5D2]|uniref:hypothetical protein n=1 Tax=Prosthecobacter sp. SYSU 5D2 TaxID=3134134 RepID=UPI0031FE885E
MKLDGWIFLALMTGVHLLAWGVYGKAEPEPALHLLVFLCPVLCGAFLVRFFEHQRSSAWLPPVLLLVTQIGFSTSPRSRPLSSLWNQYLDAAFERQVGGWEAFFAGMVLLLLMVLLAAISAFLTAEVHGWLTGRGAGAGWRFWVAVERSFTRWEKQTAKQSP